MRLRTTLIAAVAALGAMSTCASAAPTRFTKPVKLTGPAGGEPSIAADSHGDVFVVSPQAIPSGANGNPGTGLCISRNAGTSFGAGKFIGSYLGGGDNDVIVSKGTVYTADLEAVASEICKSTNRGNTFTSIGPFPDPESCSKVGIGQAGPS